MFLSHFLENKRAHNLEFLRALNYNIYDVLIRIIFADYILNLFRRDKWISYNKKIIIIYPLDITNLKHAKYVAQSFMISRRKNIL